MCIYILYKDIGRRMSCTNCWRDLRDRILVWGQMSPSPERQGLYLNLVLRQPLSLGGEKSHLSLSLSLSLLSISPLSLSFLSLLSTLSLSLQAEIVSHF